MYYSVEADCLGASAVHPRRLHGDILDAAEDAYAAELEAIRSYAAPKPFATVEPAVARPATMLAARAITPIATATPSSVASSTSDRSATDSASPASDRSASGLGTPLPVPNAGASPSHDADRSISAYTSSAGSTGDAPESPAAAGPAAAESSPASSMDSSHGVSRVTGPGEGGGPAESPASAEPADITDADAIAAAFDDPELTAEDRAAIAAVLLED